MKVLLICGDSLLQVSSRWVQSTFSSQCHCHMQGLSINLGAIKISSGIILGMLGFKPRLLDGKYVCHSLHYAAPECCYFVTPGQGLRRPGLPFSSAIWERLFQSTFGIGCFVHFPGNPILPLTNCLVRDDPEQENSSSIVAICNSRDSIKMKNRAIAQAQFLFNLLALECALVYLFTFAPSRITSFK